MKECPSVDKENMEKYLVEYYVTFNRPNSLIKNNMCGPGEMAQQLRALAVLPEDLSSIPSNHMVAHNYL